jgi:hypothetical protein
MEAMDGVERFDLRFDGEMVDESKEAFWAEDTPDLSRARLSGSVDGWGGGASGRG